MNKQFKFKHELLTILINKLNSNNLIMTYPLNLNCTYTIDYITDIITNSSTIFSTRYSLFQELATLFNVSIYSKYSRNSIKGYVRLYIMETSNNNDFLKTYVVIGNDNLIPPLKELNVIIE
jgi:hypothetical protein